MYPRKTIRRKLLPMAIAAVLTAAAGADAFDVTSCGQSVPPRTTGTLQADLVCDEAFETAVHVGPGSTLLLNGRSITGAKVGVGCHGRCRIAGPGEIVAPKVWGIAQLGMRAAYRARVRVENLTVRDAPDHGVGIQIGGGAARVEDVTLERNAAGICCSGVIRGQRATIRDNRGIGVQATDITLSDSRITGSPIGVFTLPYNSIRKQAPRLVRSIFAGNDVDIRSLDRPLLRDTSCEHSEDLNGIPWGVCSDD